MARRRFTLAPTRWRLPSALEGWAVFRFHRVAAALRHETERRLDDAPLSLTEFAALAALNRQRPLPQRVFGERIGLDRTRVSELLAGLEEEDLVARFHGAADGRQKVVELTMAGERELDAASPHLRRAEDAFLAPLSGDERDELRETLRRLEPPLPVLGDLYRISLPPRVPAFEDAAVD